MTAFAIEIYYHNTQWSGASVLGSPFSHPGNCQEIIDGKLLFFKYTVEKYYQDTKHKQHFPIQHYN